jgi:hypothetical protein
MSKRRRRKAFLIPTDTEGTVFYASKHNDANFMCDGEIIFIRNCKEGDLVPGGIVILEPVNEVVPDTVHWDEGIIKYWERVV